MTNDQILVNRPQKWVGMNNPLIPNASFIPNILFDYWMDKLSPAEFKVLMCIARKTYGWHKDVDAISIKQIEKMTGLSKKGITENIKSLVSHGLLIKIKSKTEDGDDATNRYTINVNCMGGGGEDSTQPEENCMGGGSELSTQPGVSIVYKGGSVLSTHTKEIHNTKENLYIYNKNTPPISPILQDADLPAPPDAANAAQVGVSLPSKKPRKTKQPSEFSTQVREVADKMVEILKKAHPVYRLSGDFDQFLQAVQVMIEKEQQDAETLLKTFEWACNDAEQRGDFKGWQGIICTNVRKKKPSNPAEIFHTHFSKIYSQMKSRPVRKFAPCSNDEAALEKFEEMFRRAL